VDNLRGLSNWLLPAFLASVCCTVALHLVGGGSFTAADFRMVVGFACITMIWTVAGSTLLSLAFSFLGNGQVSELIRYLTLLALGAGVGAVLVPGSTSVAAALGGFYGFSTAAFWVALNWLLYRHPKNRTRNASSS